MRRPFASALLAAAGLVAGCSSAPSTSPAGATSPVATLSPSTPSPSPTATATPTPTAAPVVASLDSCPAPRRLDGITPLARFAVDVDDAGVAPSGHIWLSAQAAGRLLEIDIAGHTVADIPDSNGPEGIEVLPDGRLAVAEQSRNRVSIVDPRTGASTVLIALGGTGGVEGIDGVALDRPSRDLLVPDSAAGRLLTEPFGGGSPTTLATGFAGRPVAAWREDAGTVLVAVERAPGLYRVGLDGHLTAVAHLGSLDEVVVWHGLAYVTDLTAGTLDAVDLATGRSRVLVSGAPFPQGLAIRPDGTLVLVDSTRRVVVEVPPCG